MKGNSNTLLKIGFGLLIFMFALAFAYFSANYANSSKYMDYWYALAIFAGIYIVIGTFVSSIFPVSLGFLFSSTLLLLHVFSEKYADISDVFKSVLLGCILILLYLSAWIKTGDKSPSLFVVPPEPPNKDQVVTPQ